MDLASVCRSIRPAELKFSLLILTPRRRFLDWLSQFMEAKGLGAYSNRRAREEEGVWLIPPIDRFSEPGMFATFVREMKPRLLLAELRQFGAEASDFPNDITAEVFDEYFEVALRTEAASVTDLLETMS